MRDPASQMSSDHIQDGDEAEAAIYEVGLREGVWRVTRDGEAFGTYRGRGAAIHAARDAARRPASRLTPAEVVIREDNE